MPQSVRKIQELSRHAYRRLIQNPHRKSLPLQRIQGQLHPLHVLTACFSITLFNIFVSSTYWFSKRPHLNNPCSKNNMRTVKLYDYIFFHRLTYIKNTVFCQRLLIVCKNRRELNCLYLAASGRYIDFVSNYYFLFRILESFFLKEPYIILSAFALLILIKPHFNH